MDVLTELETIPLELKKLAQLGIKRDRFDEIAIERLRHLNMQYKDKKNSNEKLYNEVKKVLYEDYKSDKPKPLYDFYDQKYAFVVNELEKLPLNLKQLENLGVKRDRFDEIAIEQLRHLNRQYKDKKISKENLFNEVKILLYKDYDSEQPKHLYDFDPGGKVEVFNELEKLELDLQQLGNLGLKRERFDEIAIERLRHLKSEYYDNKISKEKLYDEVKMLLYEDFDSDQPKHLHDFDQGGKVDVFAELKKIPIIFDEVNLKLKQVKPTIEKKQDFEKILVEKLRN